MILDNVGLAFSATAAAHCDPYLSNNRYIFQKFYTVASNLLYDTMANSNTETIFPQFPQDILRLVWSNCSLDPWTEIHVSQLLAICPDGDWGSLLHEIFGDTMIRLLGSVISPEMEPISYLHLARASASDLLDKMARITDDIDLLKIVQLPGPCQHHRSIPDSIMRCDEPFATHFVARVSSLYLDEPSPSLLYEYEPSASSVLLETQVSYMAAVLTNWDIYLTSRIIRDAVKIFLNRMTPNFTGRHTLALKGLSQLKH